MLDLIDLSNNNPSPIDFGKVRQHGVFGAWLKVSEGVSFVDPDYRARADAARMVKLHVGGYHFARPAESEPGRQAEFFCSLLGKVQRRDLHPVLDLEDGGHLSSTALSSWARSFLEHVHRLTGRRALTYSSPGFILPRAWPETFGTGCGLWLAYYGPDDGTDHGCTPPHPWRRIVAHQYTSKGHVAGINGRVDLTHARARRKILAHGLRGLA